MIDYNGECKSLPKISKDGDKIEDAKQMKRDGEAFYLCSKLIDQLKDVSGKDEFSEGIEWILEHAEMRGDEITNCQGIIEEKNIEIEKLKKINKRSMNDLEAQNKISINLSDELNRSHDGNSKRKVELTGLRAEIGMITDENVKLAGKGEELIVLKNDYRKGYEKYQMEIKELKAENEELKESIRHIQSMDKEEPCDRAEQLLEANRKLRDHYDTLANDSIELKIENEELLENLQTENELAIISSGNINKLRFEVSKLEGKVEQANRILEMLCK